MSGKEFADINLGYIDKETKKETIISVPEQVEETLIPNHELQHGYTYAVGVPEFNNASIYKIETRITTGNGKHNTQGIPSYDQIVKESVSAAFKNFTDSISSFSYIRIGINIII